MQDIYLNETLSFHTSLEVHAGRVGSDIHLLLTGGTGPHIGCTVLSIPRPSLSGSGAVSVTSSVLNVTGHKDEAICRLLAEEVCRAKNCTVVCTGGFHADDLNAEQIDEVTRTVSERILPGLLEIL